MPTLIVRGVTKIYYDLISQEYQLDINMKTRNEIQRTIHNMNSTLLSIVKHILEALKTFPNRMTWFTWLIRKLMNNTPSVFLSQYLSQNKGFKMSLERIIWLIITANSHILSLIKLHYIWKYLTNKPIGMQTTVDSTMKGLILGFIMNMISIWFCILKFTVYYTG